MAAIVNSLEVPLTGLRHILSYISDSFNSDEEFAELLDRTWRRYQQGRRSRTYSFDGVALTFATYRVCDQDAKHSLQITLHTDTGAAIDLLMSEAGNRTMVTVALVDRNEALVGSRRMLEEMWQQGVTSGLHDTLARFAGMGR